LGFRHYRASGNPDEKRELCFSEFLPTQEGRILSKLITGLTISPEGARKAIHFVPVRGIINLFGNPQYRHYRASGNPDEKRELCFSGFLPTQG